MTIGFDDLDTAETPAAEEQGEVLSGLRKGWLADFEKFPERFAPPKRPTAAMRLRRHAQSFARGLAFWMQCLKRLAASAAAPKPTALKPEKAISTTTAPSPRISEPSPEVIAPSSQGDILGLRDGWLADVEASPERHTPRPVTWRIRLHREFEPVLEEVAYWFACLREFAVRAATPKAKRPHISSRERVRRAEAAGRFISATFVVALAVGTVLYVATVVHIFNPQRLTQILQQ